MRYSEAERAYLWLCALSGLEGRACVAALREAHDPAQFFHGFPVAGSKGDRAAETDALIASFERKGYFFLTLLSEDYPESLKAIPDPPLVLYGKGRRELLGKRKFCIVGSRRAPAWAIACGKEIAGAVSRHFAVVTGIAEGGDSAAITGALPGGDLICVLPCGLDKCYPAAHEGLKNRIAASGLLLSEYPPETGTAKYAFHARNRILAGLSEGVLVLAAGEKSGTLITANRAAEYGRDVFALPYNVGAEQGEGCNDLIKKGAFLTTCAADILSVYGFAEEEPRQESFTSEEERVLSLLRECGELHLAELASRLNMRVFEAAAVLSALELKGAAVKSGGNRYTAV